jgi:hypothetical protein
LSKALWAHRI